MRWLKSVADLAVDLVTGVALSVSALIDEWRNQR